MNDNQQLEHFAVQTLALLAFNEWNADLFKQIEDVAQGQEFYIEEKSEIRKLCTHYEIDSSNYGDTAPTVMVGRRENVDREQFEGAFQTLHDARTADDTENILTAQEHLIELLSNAAGIVVK